MLGYYTPVLLLQAFCLYHAYKNRVEQRWYWLIVLFPVFGCLIYLLQNFSHRTSLQTISETVKEVANSNYRLEQLEKELRFSNTFANKMNLADAYVKYGRYREAIDLYADCRTGFMAEDPTLGMKLLHALYLDKNFGEAVAVGKTLQGDKSFKDADARISYAWSQYHSGDEAGAKATFEALDKSFTNYPHRLEYCKFLNVTGDRAGMNDKLAELIGEFEHMKGPERRLMRGVMREARALYDNMS